MFYWVERKPALQLGRVVTLTERRVAMRIFVRYHRHYEHRQHEQEIGYLYLAA